MGSLKAASVPHKDDRGRADKVPETADREYLDPGIFFDATG